MRKSYHLKQDVIGNSLALDYSCQSCHHHWHFRSSPAYIELMWLKRIRREKEWQHREGGQQVHRGFKCDGCQTEPIQVLIHKPELATCKCKFRWLSYVHKDLKRLGVYLWVLLSKLFIIGQMKIPNIVRKGSDAIQNFFWFFPGWSIFMRRLFTERQFGWFLLRVRASKYRTAGSRAHVRSRA